MISSDRDRAFCKSKEFQDEIDLHIKRCDELQAEKENREMCHKLKCSIILFKN